MSVFVSEPQSVIGDALTKCLSDVSESGCGRWRFTLAGRSASRATARIADGWLCLESPLDDRIQRRAGPSVAWNLLKLNRLIPGGAKFAARPDGFALVLAAEIPLEDGVDPEARILRACRGMELASGLLNAGKKVRRPSDDLHAPLSTDDSEASSEWKRGLSALCGQAGWACSERADGLVAELEASHGFYQARIEKIASGETRASVAAGTYTVLDRPRRDALAVLLLTAGGLLRMGRSAVDEYDKMCIPLFEVLLPEAPSAEEIAHALSALSLAVSLWGREMSCCSDKAAALEFLSSRGFDDRLLPRLRAANRQRRE